MLVPVLQAILSGGRIAGHDLAANPAAHDTGANAIRIRFNRMSGREKPDLREEHQQKLKEERQSQLEPERQCEFDGELGWQL